MGVKDMLGLTSHVQMHSNIRTEAKHTLEYQVTRFSEVNELEV